MSPGKKVRRAVSVLSPASTARRTHRDADVAGQEGEARGVGVVAGQHGALTGGLDQHRNTGIEIGDQQDARGAPADFDHASRQAVAGDRRLAATDAVAGPGGDQQGAHIGVARIADDPCRDEARAAFRAQVEKPAQGGVLGLQAARRELPAPEPVDGQAKLRVLIAQRQHAVDFGDDALARFHRTRQRVQDRRGGIDDAGASDRTPPLFVLGCMGVNQVENSHQLSGRISSSKLLIASCLVLYMSNILDVFV